MCGPARWPGHTRIPNRPPRASVEHPDGTPVGQINPEAVPLAAIQGRLSVGQTAAGDIRKEAMVLINDGYRAQASCDAAYEPQGWRSSCRLHPLISDSAQLPYGPAAPLPPRHRGHTSVFLGSGPCLGRDDPGPAGWQLSGGHRPQQEFDEFAPRAGRGLAVLDQSGGGGLLAQDRFRDRLSRTGRTGRTGRDGRVGDDDGGLEDGLPRQHDRPGRRRLVVRP